VGADKSWRLSRFVANSETVMWSGTLGTKPGSGTVLTLVCGDKTSGALRNFTAVVGNITLVNNLAETGTASLLGAGYRGMGFGGKSEGTFIQENPGSVEMFQGQDTA